MNSYRRRAVFALLLLTACSSNASSNDHDHPEGSVDISDAIYVGSVTDEALERLVDATPKTDARQAITVDSPDLTAPLAKDAPVAFEFHLATSTTTRAPSLRLSPARPARTIWQRSLHEVEQFLSPVRVAHAHGTPYNGTAYYLVFSDADSKPLLQVFTTGTSYTPEAADWQRLAEAPQPLSLAITSAFFEANDIPADGGPFVGGIFPFTIE